MLSLWIRKGRVRGNPFATNRNCRKAIAATYGLTAYWEAWEQKVLCYGVCTFVSSRLNTVMSKAW
jgi:hypothetical protein